jgi:hypothetical protein
MLRIFLVWLIHHGWAKFVYGISSFCGSHANHTVGLLLPINSAWSIQAELIRIGYEECPSCYWATENLSAHLAESEYCQEEY